MMKIFLALMLFSSLCYAQSRPYCSERHSEQNKIIAYLGADSAWKIKGGNLGRLKEQLEHVTLVNYSFVRIGKNDSGHIILKPSPEDIENIQTLRQLRPDLPVMIAIGGWGDREGFKPLLEDERQIAVFADSVIEMLQRYQLDGVDIDWENELLASKQEEEGLVKLLQRLHERVNPEGYCLSSAVPGTSAYWQKYPDARLWESYVDWTTVMSYDHYGTFGPRTELASSLYPDERPEDPSYSYPSTSADQAVQHYYEQGLAAGKIILGIPFYCHSYYVKNELLHSSAKPGLYISVLDANISSQVSYETAYAAYGEQLFAYQESVGDAPYQAISTYGLIPVENTLVSRFMSCDSPESVMTKTAYIKGNNPLTDKARQKVTLGGMSFWSLQQDLPFSHPNSLLKAIHRGFAN